MKSRFIISLALVVVVAGCDSSDPVTPKVDVDAALAAMTLGAGAYADFGMGTSPATPTVSASACSFDAPSAFFICPPATSNGITFTRRFQLLDANGAPLSAMDPLLVASIRAVSDLDGTVTNTDAPITFELKRHDDATLAGLQSANRVLDGTATQQLVATAEGTTLTLNDTTVTTALQLPSSPQQKYPLGGKVVSSGAIRDDPNPVQKYRIETAFDGTSFVTITASIGGESWTCRVNMAARDAAPICT